MDDDAEWLRDRAETLKEALLGDDDGPNSEVYRRDADRLQRIASRLEADEVVCQHEPYQGRCVHCDIPFKDGKPMRRAAQEPAP